MPNYRRIPQTGNQFSQEMFFYRRTPLSPRAQKKKNEFKFALQTSNSQFSLAWDKCMLVFVSLAYNLIGK